MAIQRTAPRPYGFIYRITHVASRKVYIGQSTNPASRWRGHCNGSPRMPISAAVKEQGPDAFRFEVIDSADSWPMLDVKEAYWIASHSATDPERGYNRQIFRVPLSRSIRELAVGY